MLLNSGSALYKRKSQPENCLQSEMLSFDTIVGSRTGLAIRNRTGSAWELEGAALGIVHSLEGDAQARGLLECTTCITISVREPRYEE